MIIHAIVKLRCKKETARIRDLVFLSFIFRLSWFVLRRSKCSEWLLLSVATTKRRRVIKTLLDAGVESTRELSERSGLCKAPNETKKRSGERQQLKRVLS